MELYDFNIGSGIFIQIGAGAGDLDKGANCRDGFTELVKKLPRNRIKKIILVEPNPLNIPLLIECWKDYPEALIYEIGIVPNKYQGDTIELYYCPLDTPHYQVASINKEHIYKHYGYNCELKKFIIKVKTLDSFIKEVSTDIELLALDIEGIDHEVILDTNFSDYDIKYISFEHLHLGQNKLNVLIHLINHNYKYLGLGVDHNGYDYLYIKDLKPEFHENWYSETQIVNLIKLLNQVSNLKGDIIEIGCWEGRSTISLAHGCFPETLICNDTWLGNVQESIITGATHVTELILRERDVYSIFIKNMDNTKKNYTIVKQDCIEWLKTFQGSIKFIHIDASHDYESVYETINLVLSKMVKGGIICGDDYQNANINRHDLHGGVERAVRETLPNHNNVDNLWYCII